jgi:hypothetical protein
VTAPKWLRVSNVSRFGRVVVSVEFVLAVAAIAYAGLHDFSDVFAGSPPALPAHIDASCEAIAPISPCRASIMELNAGRYRIATDVAAAKLTIGLDRTFPAQRAHSLLVRVSQPKTLQLERRAGTGSAPPDPVRLTDVAGRTVTAIPASPPIVALSFVPEAGVGPAPIVLDELGFFEDNRGLLADVRPIFPAIPPLRYHGTLVPRTIARLCVFTVIAALFVPFKVLKKFNPILLAVVCFSLCLLDLAILFSPYWAQDLRVFYAAGPLQEGPGSNLNSGPWQAFRLLQGEGLTLATGVVPWERMPGYGLFCALGGALLGHKTVLDVAMSTILLQTVFYSAALGVFAWAAGLLWSPAAVWALGLTIALLPKQLGLTQVDSIIAPIAMLVTASLCLRLKALRDGGHVRLPLDVLVHLTFAFWFVMRPDVLPGWLIVSMFLHWRSRRRLLIPAVMFLAIGCSWGVYKARYTNEFVLTTSSAGASLFCGLWEVPSRFALTCSDTAYFDWIHQHTPFQAQTQAANSFAIREVLTFWLTFPGHFVMMVFHKMLRCLDGDLWPGYPTQLQVFFFETMPRWWIVQSLLAIVGLCVVNGYRRGRLLLLAWPLLLDAPLFWVMFASEGRFYSAVGIGLLAAAVPILFEKQFYVSAVARPWRTASVVVCAAVFAVGAWPFHDWLLRHDAFHYWTPFLDPSQSPLSALK